MKSGKDALNSLIDVNETEFGYEYSIKGNTPYINVIKKIKKIEFVREYVETRVNNVGKLDYIVRPPSNQELMEAINLLIDEDNKLKSNE